MNAASLGSWLNTINHDNLSVLMVSHDVCISTESEVKR